MGMEHARGSSSETPDGTPTAPSRGSRALVLAGIALALGVFLLQVVWFWHYTNDDAYISFRYSRFLAEGRGPYFNLGEHVEGYTNFLLVLVLAPVARWLGPDAVAPAAKTVGVLSGALALVAAAWLAQRVLRHAGSGRGTAALGGVLAAGLVGVDPSFSLNATSGLETTFFSLWITAGVLVGTLEATRGRWLGSGLLFAAAILTPTPDAVTMALVAGPMLGLYVLGILVALVFGRRSKSPEDDDSDADEDEEDDAS